MKQRNVKPLTGLMALVAAIALCSCSGLREFRDGFLHGFAQSAQSNPQIHAAFRNGFKQNFLRSCEQGSSDSQHIAYCSCVDSDLEKQFDDAGLTDLGTNAVSDAQRAQLKGIIIACRNKIYNPTQH